MVKKMHEEDKRLVIEEDQEYKVSHISGVFGSLNPIGGQISFYQDIPEIGINSDGGMYQKSIKRVILFDARMSPESFRSIAYWMIDHVKDYEKWMQDNYSSKDEEEQG